jgi:ankyrin repeat protein
VDQLDVWFSADGELLPAAMRDRPNLADVGWPPQPPRGDDPADVLAEALSLAAQLGRTRVCAALLDRGADSALGPLYGITPLHFAASMGHRDAIELLVGRGAPIDVPDSLHHGTPLDWARREGHGDEVMTRLLSGR